MTSKPKQGISYAAEFRAWETMRSRCYDPDHEEYQDYGARGVTVCTRWLKSASDFVIDMGKKPLPKHDLRRRDKAKGFSPENCFWAPCTAIGKAGKPT